MAKNYNIAEATKLIVENEDAQQLTELGRRYPLLVGKLTRIAALAGEEIEDLMSFMPDNLSANKVNQAIRKALESTDADEDEEDADAEAEDDGDEDEAPAKATGKAKSGKEKRQPEEVDTDDTDYENWNNAKMYKLLGELGKRKDCKEKFGSLSHDAMLKYLKKYGPKAGEAATEDDAEEEAEETGTSYEDMTAVELYKECKKRKIKAEPKKPAKFYIGLLKKADAEAQAAEDDEDWDDDDTEEEAPAKAPEKKAGKNEKAAKSGGKAKAKPKAEDDDDEDWDI